MRNKWIKKIAVLALGVVVSAGSLAGCGAKSQIDETAVAATMGDEKILLKEINFWAKYQEALVNTSSDYYYSLFRNNGYGDEEAKKMVEQYGGSIDTIMDKVTESVESFHVIASHTKDYGVSLSDEDLKKIGEVADQFISDNKKSILRLMSADRDTVVEALKYYTLYMKMVPLMEKEGLNEEVSEEESLMKTYSYIYVSLEGTQGADGQTVAYTEAEKAQIENSLQNFIGEFRAGGGADFDSAAKEAGYTVSEHSYHPSDEEDTLIDLNKAADSLAVGDVSDVIELHTGEELTGIAVLRFDTDKNLAEMEKKKTAIIKERKAECLEKLLNSWKEELHFTVDKKVTETIKLDDKLYQKRTSKQ